MRFLDAPAPGIVGGFFTWGFDDNTGIRDEIDVELLTNDLNGDRFFTNLYNDDTFNEIFQKLDVVSDTSKSYRQRLHLSAHT